MKKIVFVGLSVLLAFGLILAGCSGVESPETVARQATAGMSTLTWDANDSAIAAKNAAVVLPSASSRSNASGPKITSNAHSADFPGLYFRWEKKQKDSGYLKVAAEVFEKYQSFILTKKVSSSYWDYTIEVLEGQEDINGFYYYAIPDGMVWIFDDGKVLDGMPKKKLVENKAANNMNINMVFISGFKAKGHDVAVLADDFQKDAAKQYVITFKKALKDADGTDAWVADRGKFLFQLMQGEKAIGIPQAPADDGTVTFVVDAAYGSEGYTVVETIADGSKYSYSQQGVTPVYVSEAVTTVPLYSRANDNAFAVNFPAHLSYIETLLDKDMLGALNAMNPKPVWIWDRAESWMRSGAEIVHYTTSVLVPENAKATESLIYFGADNAAVLYVNGEAVKWSKALDGKTLPVATSDAFGLTDITLAGIDYDADPVSLACADIAEYLVAGALNEIVFYAANADVSADSRYTTDVSNPGCFIFGGSINFVEEFAVAEEVVFYNTKAPNLGKATSGTAVNAGVDGKDQMAKAGNNNWFTYIKLDKNALKAGQIIEIDITDGNSGNERFTVQGKGKVEQKGNNLVVTLDGVGKMDVLLYDNLSKNPQSDATGYSNPAEFKYGGEVYLYVKANEFKFYN